MKLGGTWRAAWGDERSERRRGLARTNGRGFAVLGLPAGGDSGDGGWRGCGQWKQAARGLEMMDKPWRGFDGASVVCGRRWWFCCCVWR